MKHRLIIPILVFISLFSMLVLAHEEMGTETSIIPDYIIALLDLHDSIHWMIAIPFIITCYYFRYIVGRKAFFHPAECGKDEGTNRKYKGEFFLNKLHRYFFWLMLIFILIHLSETVMESLGLIHYNFRLFSPYVFPFTSEASVEQSETIQLLGSIAEWFYVLTLLGFLSSCHFLRHFIGGRDFCFSCSPLAKARGKLYGTQTKLNNYHGILFWLSVISMVLILVVGGHL